MPCQTPPTLASAVRHRRGSVMVYTVVSMVTLCGLVSLAVDYGHVQSVRQQMQRSADAAARGYLDLILHGGNSSATAQGYATYLTQSTYDPIDGASAPLATVTITPGTWNSTTSMFTAVANSTTAVKVVISRHGAAGNGVPLYFGKLVGRPTCDVNATAVAALVGGQTGSVSVPSTASPYLAGMPPGSTTQGYGDNTSNATPYQVTSIPVVPGTYITMTNVAGQTSIVPGVVPNSGGAGDTSLVLHHGQNYNSSPNPPYPNPENGVGDAMMPADALMGVFMTNSAPDLSNPPAAVNWTDAAHANQATYTNLVPQAPFLIGTGQTTGGATQQFLVPPGATQLYLGIWDGVQYSNNSGTLTGTLGVQQKVMLVQEQ